MRNRDVLFILIQINLGGGSALIFPAAVEPFCIKGKGELRPSGKFSSGNWNGKEEVERRFQALPQGSELASVLSHSTPYCRHLPSHPIT